MRRQWIRQRQQEGLQQHFVIRKSSPTMKQQLSRTARKARWAETVGIDYCYINSTRTKEVVETTQGDSD